MSADPMEAPPPAGPQPIDARRMPIGMGSSWIHQGWRLYRRQPMAMTGILVTYLFCIMILANIPVLGIAFTLFLIPGCSTGFLIAGRVIENDQMPFPNVLISAFRQPDSAFNMWKLGGIYFLVVTLGLALVVWIGGEPLMQALEQAANTQQLPMPSNAWSIAAASLAVFIPLSMAYWYAPILVHWHGLTPIKAIFFSLVACWRNKGAFTLYFFMYGALLVGLRTLVTGIATVLHFSPAIAELIWVPISLFIAGIMYASFYPCYVSVFGPPAASELPKAL